MNMLSRFGINLSGILYQLLISSWLINNVNASVYVDATLVERVYSSVAYFDFADTEWPYLDDAEMLIGPITVLTSSNFDKYFIDLQQKLKESPYVGSIEEDHDNPGFEDKTSPSVTSPPNFLLVEFGSSPYSKFLPNVMMVAEWVGADFVILALDRNASLYERFRFWWDNKIPGVPMDIINEEGNISRKNAKSGIIAVGPRQGEALLHMLDALETWNLDSSSHYYFGIDCLSQMKGRRFVFRVVGYVILVFLFCQWVKVMERRDAMRKNGVENAVKFTPGELGMGEIQASTDLECCICLETMPQGERVRILPCRHVFHHDCINGWFQQHKYNCPMCKMDLKKHLEERRNASEELEAILASTTRRRTVMQRLRFWNRRRIHSLNCDSSLVGVQRLDGDAPTLRELELSVSEENPAPGVVV